MNLDQQNMREKPFWNKDTLSKDASHSLACFHEKPLSDSIFRHIFAIENQTRGFSISGILGTDGLLKF